MDLDPEGPAPRTWPPDLDLSSAHRELQHLLLDGSDIAEFLTKLAVLTAALVSGSSCGIMMRRDHLVSTAASSDAFALLMDEIQFGRGLGPCLQALHTGQTVQVPTLAGETRWGDFSIRALAAGVGSTLSVVLATEGEEPVGALNLYSRSPHSFGAGEVSRVELFAEQAATALTLMIRRSNSVELEHQLQDAFASRALIDQALGMVMAQRRISSVDAFAILRESSQLTNRKLVEIAAGLITSMTGHPPEPPRPFTRRTS
jgi:GAF domain-containing protein